MKILPQLMPEIRFRRLERSGALVSACAASEPLSSNDALQLRDPAPQRSQRLRRVRAAHARRLARSAALLFLFETFVRKRFY